MMALTMWFFQNLVFFLGSFLTLQLLHVEIINKQEINNPKHQVIILFLMGLQRTSSILNI